MDDKKFNFQFRARKINLILHFLKYPLKGGYFKIICFNKNYILYSLSQPINRLFFTLAYYKDMKDPPCQDYAKDNNNVYFRHI